MLIAPLVACLEFAMKFCSINPLLSPALFCFLLLCGGSSSEAQFDDWAKMKAIAPQGYVCGFAAESLKVDGRLEEALWKAAPWTEAFVDIEGDRKPKPRLRTRAKMLWDREYFYIAAQLDEPHVWGTLTKHDAVIFQDNDFEVFIDPDGDNHEYYEFEMNALNTTWDLFLPRPYKDAGTADNRWEIPGLQSAVHVQGTLNDPSDKDEGWSVEIAIPWKVLAEYAHRPAPPSHGDTWRVNFSRVEWQQEVVEGKYRKVPDTKEDNWVWSPQGIIDMHRPERWGFVQFSKEPPGDARFVPDPTLAARDVLMGIYHAQKSFQKEHGKWATDLKQLGLTRSIPGFPQPLAFRATKDGFEVELDVPVGPGKTERWQVQQDSRLRNVSKVPLQPALEKAGANRAEIEKALDEVSPGQREGMEFLVANMPSRDLESLTAEFLLAEVKLAYQTWEESPWKSAIPQEIFFNNVLPYASINERRDAWRQDFRKRFGPLVKEAKTPSAAAAILNQKIFSELKVRYSTQRPKADQSPFESIKSGTASCTGLSVLLIDACRSVGVPARFVGTPLWSDNSGNHSWVEIWDDGWHFTGAAEPSGDKLDQAWFIDRASKAQRDDPRHAIYAVSFQHTPRKFPLIWDRDIDYVFAVNVTDRYANRAPKPPDGTVETMFTVLDRPGGKRIAATLKITDAAGKAVLEGTTKDEGFDSNDFLSLYLPAGETYQVEIRQGETALKSEFKSEQRARPLVWYLTDGPKPAAKVEATSKAVTDLAKFLAEPADQRGPLDQQPFAAVPLSKADAAQAAKLLWQDHAAALRKSREAEMKAREVTSGNLKMPFTYQLFGDKPATGRSLYISMHGGGGAPKQVNDQQWENQKKLYRLEEGVYLVPRAPTDTWDLWHQSHIDGLFGRLIENMIVFEDVDPDRVYLMGYSAGGDGVYQLAPRMADRLAAAAMMAGHPNETSPLGLRNLPFAIHVGELDSAYNRNKVAREWETKLADLHKADPDGYVHSVTLEAGKGHWMDRKDAVAIPWMAKYRRNQIPKRIVWKQDDVTHHRFYWLAVGPKDFKDRAEVVASREGQKIDLQSQDVTRLTVRLNDDLLDLDQPVSVTRGDKVLFQGPVSRTIGVLAKTLAERGDPKGVFSGEVSIDLPADGTGK